MKHFFEMPHFSKTQIMSKSVAAAGLCDWCLNICEYQIISVEVIPKKKALAATNARLADANVKLEQVNTMLKALQDKVDALQADLDVPLRPRKR